MRGRDAQLQCYLVTKLWSVVPGLVLCSKTFWTSRTSLARGAHHCSTGMRHGMVTEDPRNNQEECRGHELKENSTSYRRSIPTNRLNMRECLTQMQKPLR